MDKRLIAVVVMTLSSGIGEPASACAVPNAPAKVVHLAKPNYPMLAMQVGAHGTFDVAVALDALGHVTSASVRGKHPYAGLDVDAIAAAKASTYAPARHACKPIASHLTVPIVFSLPT
jgi:TonB family protein